MSLYIRLQCSFYRHRKLIRLKAILKDDAKWIPPALWAWAAENQPDGNLSDYTAEEIAMLIGYNKDATSMLQALKTVGFIDENMMIHDWTEHNGYHSAWKDRAKRAAEVRWGKEKENQKEKIGQEEEKKRDKQCTSIATSMLQAFEECWKLYPDKSGKPNAMKAFVKYAPDKEKVKAGILRYLAYVDARRRGGFRDLKYKNGSTFFNGREWESEWTLGNTQQARQNRLTPEQALAQLEKQQ